MAVNRITTKEAASRVGVSPTFLYKLVEDGEVPGHIEELPGGGRKFRFMEQEIDAYNEDGGYQRTRHLRPDLVRRDPTPAAGEGDEVGLRRQLQERTEECLSLRSQVETERLARLAADMRVDELQRTLQVRNQMIRSVVDGDPSWADVLGPPPE
ncbi:MAG: hypothetical protein JWO77_1283 [Ilumatobacteraceae bacterium]|nr:hypothetical protein [Ilumatobacteraceae bacterium]